MRGQKTETLHNSQKSNQNLGCTILTWPCLSDFGQFGKEFFSFRHEANHQDLAITKIGQLSVQVNFQVHLFDHEPFNENADTVFDQTWRKDLYGGPCELMSGRANASAVAPSQSGFVLR